MPCVVWLCASGAGLPSPACAVPITYRVASISVDAQRTHPGLVVFADDSALDTSPFQLDDGEFVQVDLFRVGTYEISVNLDDLFEKDISADLAFGQPSGGGVVSGTSRGKWRILDDIGKVRWDGPVQIDTGVSIVELALTDVDFGTPGSALVRGTFTQLTSVPEPASALLVGLGLGAVTLHRRRLRAHLR